MAIEIVDMSKSYGQNAVFGNFGCQIEEGAVNCIMGASGKGKTTLIRILLGLEKPDSGQISGIADLKKSVVFQEDRLCENLSAESNIRLACRKALKMNSITEAMLAVGLNSDCLKQPVRSMSGGQKRRVAILRALMAEYDILFMDEPFKGLDAEIKKKTMSYAKEQSNGKTVILVTHDKKECETMDGKMIYI
ncbi:MAG: ATP-binding cassette domain-containing protein [Oscillospiraceae bacterium]|nr:ATP-binding cassette domain-containing protein [Oscillospiraceae bacterium]